MSDPTRADRIAGTILGHAIGDALGLATEFMSAAEAAATYPGGVRDFAQIVQDEHRSRWTRGAWTDDTDQMLCILDAFLEHGSVDPNAVAVRLLAWADAGGMGIGRTVQRTVDRRSLFARDAFAAALQIWTASRGRVASNGAVMRTSVVGLCHLDSASATAHAAAAACRITHFDPRCVASCIVVSEMVRRIVVGLPVDLAELQTLAETFDPRCREAFAELDASSPAALRLDEGLAAPDERDRIGYTLKALSAGLWVHLHAPDFETGVCAIVEAGGDADTNAAVAGALLGARFGRGAIPSRWRSGLHGADRLETRIEALLRRLGESEG